MHLRPQRDLVALVDACDANPVVRLAEFISSFHSPPEWYHLSTAHLSDILFPQLGTLLGRTSAPSATSLPWLMRVTPIQ